MRLVDAETLLLDIDCLESCRCTKSKDWMIPTSGVCKTICEAPTVDAVPVVRCKDCKHWDEESTFCCYTAGCYGLETQPNWFCADGERMTDATD